jgi:hypothetical protein
MLDWKNSDLYPTGNEVPPERWAWEFLRRNADYRADFEKMTSELATLASNDPTEKTNSLERAPNCKLNVYEPPPLQGESLNSWRRRCVFSGVDPQVTPRKQWYAKRWHLHQMVDPDEQFGNAVRFQPLAYPKAVTWEEVGDYFAGDEENFSLHVGYAVLAFDLSKPIKQQLTKAEHFLQAKKKEQAKALNIKRASNRQQNFPTYLRVLDALGAGVKPKQIADELFPHKNKDSGPEQKGTKHVSDLKKSALRMCSPLGYLGILQVHYKSIPNG